MQHLITFRMSAVTVRCRPLLLRSIGEAQGFALAGDLAFARLKSPLLGISAACYSACI
jgi:hypothetical protein